MTEPTIITVKGQAFAESAPERASVSLSLAFDGADRGRTRSLTHALHARCTDSVVALHDHRSGPVTEWSSEQLRVWGERPWNNEGKRLPIVYHAAASLVASFSNFEAMASWIDETSALDGVTVGGIVWDVTDITRSELTARARKDAIASAAETASVYAAALGLGAISPLAISDPGLLSGNESLTKADATAFTMRAGAPSGGIEFNPGRIRVEVEVHARFAAATPG